MSKFLIVTGWEPGITCISVAYFIKVIVLEAMCSHMKHNDGAQRLTRLSTFNSYVIRYPVWMHFRGNRKEKENF